MSLDVREPITPAPSRDAAEREATVRARWPWALLVGFFAVGHRAGCSS
jgi:hypothetical protein